MTKTVQSILLDAINARLSLEDLLEINFKPRNEFEKIVVEDIQYAVEHTSGYLFKPGVNETLWKQSEEYHLLIIDSLLLDYCSRVDIQKIIACRNMLGEKWDSRMTVDKIKKNIKVNLGLVD